MNPSRPSSTDPNAPYRAAIAALGGNFVNEQEVGQQQHAPAQYEQNAYEGLAPRRNANRDRLNQIAHHLGSGVRVALESMTPEQAHPENVAGPSIARVPSPQIAADPNTSLSTIRQMISDTGLNHRRNLYDYVIQNRLESANLSQATFIAAMQMIQTPNHPALVAMGVNNDERNTILDYLVAVMSHRRGFNQITLEAGQNADNNPHNFIAGIIQQIRDVNP